MERIKRDFYLIWKNGKSLLTFLSFFIFFSFIFQFLPFNEEHNLEEKDYRDYLFEDGNNWLDLDNSEYRFFLALNLTGYQLFSSSSSFAFKKKFFKDVSLNKDIPYWKQLLMEYGKYHIYQVLNWYFDYKDLEEVQELRDFLLASLRNKEKFIKLLLQSKEMLLEVFWLKNHLRLEKDFFPEQWERKFQQPTMNFLDSLGPLFLK